MMGTTHVSSGAVAGLLTLPALPAMSPVLSLGWVVACAGFALLPDLDHPSATASRMWGPVSQVASRGVALVSGGHRWGTHDAFLAPVAAAALVWVACQSRPGAFLVCAVAAGLALQGLGASVLGRAGPVGNLAVSVLAGYALTSSARPELPLLMAASAAVGCLVHIAGDALTPGMVPLPVVWIWRRARVGLPVAGTGGLLERLVVAPGLGALALWLAWGMAPVDGWTGVVDELARWW